MPNPEWLKAAVQRSGEDPWSLGHVFEQYRKLQHKSAEQLAAELDCSLEVLDWLALCRRPDEERFIEHLHLIQKRFAVEPRRLAVVLRHVEVLEGMPEVKGEGDAGERPFLLAARDHSGEDDETNS